MPAPLPPAPEVKHYDLRKGIYSVAVSIGKTRQSALQEGAEEIGTILQSQPQLMPLIGPLYFQYRDFPGAKQLAELLGKLRDKQFPGLMDDKSQGPTVEQAQAQVQQLSQQMQMMQAQLQGAMSQLQAKQAEQQTTLAKAQMDNETKLQIAGMNQQTELMLKSLSGKLEQIQQAVQQTHEADQAGADRAHEAALAVAGGVGGAAPAAGAATAPVDLNFKAPNPNPIERPLQGNEI